jgi:hypothetical protein
MWRIGAKNRTKGIRIAKTRTTGITKVTVTAKTATAKTTGANRIKAHEDKTANALLLETILLGDMDMHSSLSCGGDLLARQPGWG